jgi:GT2 family glycosyltransferase
VGGRVLPSGDDIYSTYYTVYRVLEPPVHINTVIGANCIFWKQPVVDAGLFDEYFIAPGGEEIALCMKLWLKGYRFGFEERAVVYHEYRKGFKNFIITFYHYGYGERVIYENQLNDYLQYMQYPEQMYNNLAFRNLLLFQAIFFLRMVGGIARQYLFLGNSPVSDKKKVMLMGLFALAHISYHLGRGTFSGKLVKQVKKYLLNHPEGLRT